MGNGKRICVVDGCEDVRQAKGFCNKHYARFKRHGDPLGGGTENGEPLAWLRENIAKCTPDNCLIWPFGTTRYGWLVYKGKRQTAHRVALILFTGIDPPELEAAHGPCHNRCCINPYHSSWETHLENLKHRLRDGTLCRGGSHGNNKLTESQVIAIRSDDTIHRIIAEEHGVCRENVGLIKRRKNWGWLE